MKKKIKKALKLKEGQLKEVAKMYDEYNTGLSMMTIRDIDKNEIEIKAQIAILRHLLSN